MRVLRGLVALLLALGACGDDDGGGSSADGGNRQDGGGRDGSAGTGLIVHAGYLIQDEDSWIVLSSGEHVLLESTTDASFPDVALPVDVHRVDVKPLGHLTVRSYLAVDAHEIWLEGTGPIDAYERHISGTVTSDLEGGGWVVAAGGGPLGLRAAGTWDAGGFDLTLHGYTTDPVDVVAYQTGGGSTAVRAGALRGVDVSGEAPVGGLAIAVDHPFDQSLAVSVTDDEPYGGAYKAQLVFAVADQIAFFTEDQDLPIETPSPEMDTAMQALQRYVWVPLGEGDGYDFGPLQTARMYQKVAAGADSVTVDALAPFELHQPAFAPEESPTAVAAGSLDAITWTADPDAVQVELMVQASGDPNAYEEFCWEIFAPAALGRAEVPDLPDEVFAGDFLAARDYALYMTQQQLEGVDREIDLYTQPDRPPSAGYRNTRWLSYFTVE